MATMLRTRVAVTVTALANVGGVEVAVPTTFDRTYLAADAGTALLQKVQADYPTGSVVVGETIESVEVD